MPFNNEQSIFSHEIFSKNELDVIHPHMSHIIDIFIHQIDDFAVTLYFGHFLCLFANFIYEKKSRFKGSQKKINFETHSSLR